MSNELAELHQLADEVELQIHLGTMQMRDRWQSLKMQLARVTSTEIAELRDAIRQLRDELVLSMRGDYVTGW